MVDPRLCNFIEDEEGIIVCSRCNYVPVAGKPIFRACPLAEKVLSRTCRYLGEPKPSIKVECGCPSGGMVDQATAECLVRKRCIPNWYPPDVTAWGDREESKMYALCCNCERKAYPTIILPLEVLGSSFLPGKTSDILLISY